MKPPRVQGIDVARGIASVLMIQGHAFDAWASSDARATWGYRAVEGAFLQTLALPAFLVLSGAAIALRIEAADARGEDAASVRRGIVLRGLQIVGIGYALNALSALMDGWEGWPTIFRADVLHVIGLSLVVLGGIGIRAREDGTGGVRGAWLTATVVLCVIVPIAVCPILTPMTRDIEGPLGFFVGLFSEVRGVTRMPLIPLIAWAALGVHVARVMSEWNRGARSIAGAPEWLVVRTLGRAIGIAIVFTGLTWALVALLGGPLTRSHPAVITNAIELAGRGVAVLALGAWITNRLPLPLRAWLVRLGRGSLWAYAFHIPFCYGRLGELLGLRSSLGIVECVGAASVLVLASWLVVWARDVARSAVRPTAAG